MNRRTAKVAATLLAGVLAAVLLPITLLSAPAGAFEESFTLTMDSGELSIRGSEEPAELLKPTTITGTNTDGALTGGNLTTPTISFEREITQPAITTIFVDASFSQVTPGSLSGSISPDGEITLQTALKAELDIEVEILPGNQYTCTASPVQLTMTGTHDGSQVVLTDADFTVPATPITATCPDFVAGGMNEQLQGSGHSISLAMTGPITPAPEPGDESLTALTVSPEGGATVGDSVTLTANVSADPAGEGTTIPEGVVDFKDGTTVIGSGSLDSEGKASLTTTALPAGTRSLTAEYRGSAPVYAGSTSPSVSYVVASAPAVVADIPSTVETGGDAVPIGLEVSNTGLGTTLSNARIDIEIRRTTGRGPIGPDGGTPRISLSTVEGGTATPIDLVHSGELGNQLLSGSIGGTTGFPLPAGTVDVTDLELQVASGVDPGGLAISFKLVHVDPTTGEILGQRGLGGGEVTMVEPGRRSSTISAGDPGFPEIGWPATPGVVPGLIRPGASAEFYNPRFLENIDGTYPSGTVEVLFDGKPIAVRLFDGPLSEPFVVQRVPISSSGQIENTQLAIPADATPGVHQVTIRYGGDALFNPTSATFPVTVDQPVGTTFECLQEGPASARWRANIDVFASVPQLARAGSLTLNDARLRLLAPRYGLSLHYFGAHVDPANDPEVSAPVSPDGEITATSMSQTGNSAYEEDPSLGTDHAVTFHGAKLNTTLTGAPGTAVPLALESLSVVLDATYRYELTCEPVDGPLEIGTTTIAGTTLAVSPEGESRTGQAVTLSSSTLPARAGTVEFLDGTTTIGVVPVDANGNASMTTDDLPAGTRNLTAKFRGGPGVPSTTSEVVSLIVADPQCGSTSDAGNGASVRLGYMVLLDRCPDASGYAYWKGQLDAGTITRATFARQLSDSLEAREAIVDDAYHMMLGRSAEPAGRLFWARRLGANARYDTLLASLALSGSEFSNLAGGTPAGFVTRVYEQVLGRTPIQSEVDFWVGFAEARGRAHMVRTMFRQAESVGALVKASYDEVLGRQPNAEELAADSATLGANSNRSALYASLINRDEFHTRAQTLPNLL